MNVTRMALDAKHASAKLGCLSGAERNAALINMARALEESSETILTYNAEDVRLAQDNGVKTSFIDRLTLTPARITAMANGIRSVQALPDPIGFGDSVVTRPNGLSIEKRRVPLGLVGMIYEARPNVTSDAIALCIKSGNACLLRGGSEAIRSNTAIADCLSAAAYHSGIPEHAIALLRDTDREAANEMMSLKGVLDVLIPRGGAGLIQSVLKNASVPVIETGVGVCHTFIDESAPLDMALAIAENAKCSRPSVCNAMETLLVHERIAPDYLPRLASRLAAYPVELRCCPRARAILPQSVEATEADWATEYDDLILSIRVVDNLSSALAHIAAYGTHHSEAIVTSSYQSAERFLNEVDASAVYVNASTRFTDGEEFGLGAEIGISTQKLHARGPMGLSALTSIKYVVRGSGQIR